MKTIKQIGYKLIVVLCIVASLWCFIGSCPVNAASKVKTDDFYYSGTVKGSYTVNKGFFSKLVEALEGILDYILGVIAMAIRIPFVGWTELIEKMLTWVVESATGMEVDVEGVDATGIVDPDDYITLDAIIFNKIPLFNINVFEEEVDSTHDALGHEIPPDEQTVAADDSLIMILKHTIAGWYYTFRMIAIMAMLIMLIYIGLKLATTTIATDKAVYKKMLTDWLVGMILVFSIHYVILVMINFNEILVDEISKMKLGYKDMKVYEYGLEERATQGVTDTELEESIYDEVRTRAYDAKYTVGTTGMIMYMILVYYAWKFTFIYMKRYLVIAVLIMMAPIVSITYAYNKVRNGKAVIFSNWLKELFFLIMLQSIHALMYVVFFETALAISLASIGGMILAFVMIHFMSKAEGIFRKIFGIKGSLTDSTDKGKLKDITSFIGNAALGAGAVKAAVGMGKKTAGIITKPVTAAGNFAFGKAMAKKANKLSSLVNGVENEDNKDKEKEEIDDLTRRNKLELGAFAKNLKNGIYDGDKAKLEKALKQVMERVPLSNDKGALSEEEYLAQIQNNQDMYAKEYDKFKKGERKYNRQKRWKEITNPFQYVEFDTNKKKYVRKKNKREHENWGPIFKYMSKKTDGTGVTFSKYMNTTYLLGINDRTKKAWKKQAAILKDGVTGFFGILVGMPLIVAEPAVGMAFMAKGISSAGKVINGDGRRKMRNLNGIVMDGDGKYRLVRYEGKSLETMKNGVQASARETFEDIEQAREKHNREVVRRTKKHKSVYDRLMGIARIGGIGAGVTGGVATTLNTVKSASFAPMAVGTVAGVAVGAKLTGHILGNMGANAYMAWHETVREERKAATKEWEKEWSSIDTALDFMAEKYYEAELQVKDATVDQKTTKFEDAYVVVSANAMKKIDDMQDDATLLRETSYEEEIVLEEKEDGKKKLALDTETKIIDNAIIETVQKCGIIDITECDIKQGNRIEQVNKAITEVLIQKGVIDKTQKANDIIENLDKRIEERKSKLDTERPKAVEEKMTDDAIISIMKNENITDPDKVKDEHVMEAFTKKYEKMVDVPTEQSASAIDALEKQKVTQTQTSKTKDVKMEAVKASVQSSIQARKAILSDKSKQKLDDATRQKLKDELKRKKTLELDVMVLTAEDQLAENNEENTTENPFTSSTIGEFDFVAKDNQDEVLKMLQLQTELHKSKKELSEVRAHTTEKTKQRVMSYKVDSGLIDLKGSVNVDQYRDGSRRVVDKKPLSNAATQSIEDVLKKVKSNV